MKRLITLIILIIAILLFGIAIILGLKNQQLIDVNYLIAENEVPLATLSAIIFMFGFIVAGFFGSFFYLKLKMKTRQLRKVNNKQLKELEQLRNASQITQD
ncbi:LapA family protein [Psychromonas sp. PT13]|uniref:LapA family protein n=1 Tax=Psychromonas sp. PT13 TaxID=3439547 RepID=UPI003EBBE999